MKNYSRINSITGWIVFLIAAIVYGLTIEPTVSLWDCGEFIAASYKLEIGHPPGAPLFLMLGRLFSLFASSPDQVAAMINFMSGMASAFTILFLFWSITHLAKKMLVKEGKPGKGHTIAILSAGIIGALAYAFSDTFWFSAVEGEVYALSSLFTAAVFWAILKWENVADQAYASRWLVFIAFLVGLSIGVHLLNLLAIPAIVFIYYFKKYPTSTKGIIYAFLISIVILGSVMYGIIPGFVMIASWFEMFFVNTIGMPYNSGTLIYIVLVIAAIVYGIWYTRKHQKALANTIILCLTVVLIGYSSYALIMVRAYANPPMEQNNPDNAFSMLNYLNRTQYGSTPIFYGPYYNAPIVDQKVDIRYYGKIDGKYKRTHIRPKYVYDDRFTTVFPRMHSDNPSHAGSYRQWGRIEGRSVQVTNYSGQQETKTIPSFTSNLRFFFSYQLGHMYFRYFMWNFVGRQNDTQGHGGVLDGNWLSGVKFIDEARLGPQDNLPETVKNHPSRNVYYFLPLILGLIGVFYQYKKANKDFWVVFLLFVFTGIAIVVYLNQPPIQPRERDYAYAASFYAFAIWIGLGVLTLYEVLSKYIKEVPGAAVSGLICLIVPVLMGTQNWDDHDRSGRTVARDFAHNYLDSCEPNAILFTHGDNDTFPLWYAQEVEGYRTDVRVICMPYLSTDWYIEQMTKQAYESAPLPLGLDREDYRMGKRDHIPLLKKLKDPIDLRLAINDFLLNDDKRTQLELQDGRILDFLPNNEFYLPVDSTWIMQTGTVKPNLADQIVDTIKWTINRNQVYKSDFFVLSLLANNNWERPVYFTSIAGESVQGLQDYFQLEGFAYRFVPIKNNAPDKGNSSINTDILYENYLNKFAFGNLKDPNVFADHYSKRTTLILRLRQNFNRLASHLLYEGKPEMAIKALDKVMEELPPEKLDYDVFLLSIAESYLQAEAPEKANQLLSKYANYLFEDISYLLSFSKKYQGVLASETQQSIDIFQEIIRIAMIYEQSELQADLENKLKELAKLVPGN